MEEDWKQSMREVYLADCPNCGEKTKEFDVAFDYKKVGQENVGKWGERHYFLSNTSLKELKGIYRTKMRMFHESIFKGRGGALTKILKKIEDEENGGRVGGTGKSAKKSEWYVIDEYLFAVDYSWK